MKKVAIFFLLVVTSLLLTSCTYEEVEAYLLGNPNTELTPAQQAQVTTMQVEKDRGGGRP